MSTTKTNESRKIARISLIIMGVGFIATIPFQGSFWVDLLQGGFEAGLVGGLADWFAVTALFRHPLGLKIPHTALLPNNRQRMTNALVKMLKNDWLSKESIQEKVKTVQFTDMLIPIVEKEIQKDAFKKGLVELIKQLIRYIDVEKLTPFVKKQLIANLSKIEMRKVLGIISERLLSEQFDKKALDYLLKRAETWLNNEQTGQKLGTVSMNMLNKIEVDGILQFALKSIQSILNEEKLGNIVKNLLLSVVSNLQKEEDPNRKALIIYIQKEILGLDANKNIVEGVEKWKNQFLANWDPDQTIKKSLEQIKLYLVEMIEDDKFVEAYLIPFVQHILDRLKEKNIEIDQWIRKQIAVLIEKNHSQIGNLVQENLNKLDNETLIHMMENNIGKDLQWIRVNGAVCGFIIGIILTGVQAIASIF